MCATWHYVEAALAGRVDAAQAEKWERALSELRKVGLRHLVLSPSSAPSFTT